MTAKRKTSVLPGSMFRLQSGADIMVHFKCIKRDVWTTYIAEADFKFILIKMPLVAGLANKIYSSPSVVVKYRHKGSVFSFDSVITAYHAKPVPVLWLEFPDKLLHLELRTAPRFSCTIPAHINFKLGEFQGVMTDISKDGCRVRFFGSSTDISGKVSAGEQAVVSFSLGELGDVMADLEIKNCSVQKDNMTIGGVFTSLDEFELETLDKFLSIMALHDRIAQ